MTSKAHANRYPKPSMLPNKPPHSQAKRPPRSTLVETIEAESPAERRRKVMAATASALRRARRIAQVAARDQLEFELAFQAARASGESERSFARAQECAIQRADNEEEGGDEDEWEDVQDPEMGMDKIDVRGKESEERVIGDGLN